jgi:FkbM family methyltransferase
MHKAATVRLSRWDLQVLLPATWRGVGRPIFAFREHYEPELEYLPNLLFPGATFVDVGANLGIYTLVASRIVGHLGRVIAFEPSAQSFPLLQRNITLNSLKNVSAFPLALSAEKGTVRLYHAPCCPSGNSFGQHPAFHGSFENVGVESLDDAVQRIPAARLDVIKMDVQGAEELVLRGARKVVASMKPAIIFEIWPEGADLLGLSPYGAWNLLNEMGYKFFTVCSASTTSRIESPAAEAVYANVLAIHQEKLKAS